MIDVIRSGDANRGREIIHAANTALGHNVPVIK